MVKEKIKSKRTPISGEKDARLNELEKLKAKRNSMKTNSLPIKAKQKLEFQQSKGFMTFQPHDKISKLLNMNNDIEFFKAFYEYHTEKLKYIDVTSLILKVKFATTHSLVDLESVFVATVHYLKHTAPLTYSL